MMMDRCHLEDAFLAQLVGTDLQDHRQRLNYEYSADEREQEFLLDDHGYGTDCATERQGSHIAHENVRGMRVIPEKSDGGADHGAAENRQLGDLRHTLQFEIGRERRVAADVRQYCQGSGRDYGASDCQAVESIGQIHCVAGAYNHQSHESHEEHKSQRPEMRKMLPSSNHQIRPKLLEEWDDSFVEYIP